MHIPLSSLGVVLLALGLVFAQPVSARALAVTDDSPQIHQQEEEPKKKTEEDSEEEDDEPDC